MTAETHFTAMPPLASRRKSLLGRSIVSGVACGVVVAALAVIVAHLFVHSDDSRDVIQVLGYLGWGIGFLIGIGALNHPLRWALARPEPTHEEEMDLAGKDQGVWRYFRFTTDHKVVGIQYFVMSMVLFAAGGLGALLIRLEVMQPGAKMFPIQTYNTIVGMHGLAMIVGTIIMISGPFGNFVVPIMIGARDMAFPRLNALSFWLLFVAVSIFITAPFFGGFPTGWTAYAPLSDQAPLGIDAYSLTIFFFILSTAVAAVNVLTTVVTMRAPGMSPTRLPVLVWGVTASSVLGLVVMPAFLASQYLLMLDRTIGTGFYVGDQGGSQWLYEHLFWFMGHPEVYVIVLPAFAVILELLPVFTRKPLFAYKAEIGGILGVSSLSMIVWAHHMFVTGWSPIASGPFMLTTELISIPTGIVFLGAVGTLWRGRAWMTVPMLFVLAFLWNFVIGGVTGLYLADVPTDVQLHGSLFVTAHFHYTLMGGGMMGFFAAVYYWYPKLTGKMYNDTMARIQFWMIQIGFNMTFLAMFYVGLQGEPRRVGDYAAKYATGNAIATLGAFIIAASMVLFWYNLVMSKRRGPRAEENPWHAQTLEWSVPTPVPLENFEHIPVVVSGPYEYGVVEDDLDEVEPIKVSSPS